MATDDVVPEHPRAIREKPDRADPNVSGLVAQMVSGRLGEHSRDGHPNRRDRALALVAADVERITRRLDPAG